MLQNPASLIKYEQKTVAKGGGMKNKNKDAIKKKYGIGIVVKKFATSEQRENFKKTIKGPYSCWPRTNFCADPETHRKFIKFLVSCSQR